MLLDILATSGLLIIILLPFIIFMLDRLAFPGGLGACKRQVPELYPESPILGTILKRLGKGQAMNTRPDR